MGRIYSNLKFLGFPDRVEALRQGRMAAPIHVRIKPINTCNHACWYCAYRADQLQLGEGMAEADRLPEAKMREIVADLIAMGVEAVTFSGGGEPLLYRSLPEHVAALAKGGVKVATLTNGSNLKGRMAEAFARYGSWVRVSLDAWDDASYARQRGLREGAFSQLMTNLEAFAGRSSPCVLGASFIVGRENHAHIHEVCARLKQSGVAHVKIAAAVVANDGVENNSYHAAIRAAVAEQIARAQELADEGFSVIDHYHEAEERFDKSYRLCGFMHFLTVIGADQAVYSCQDRAYTEGGRIGSIAERSFRDLWFAPETREYLWNFDPSRSCRHHCVAHAKNEAIAELLSIDPDHAGFV